MCLFLLILLAAMGAPFFALVWGAMALFTSIQTKRLGRTKVLTKEQIKKQIEFQILCSAILMFIAFMIYLCIRYGVS